MGAGTQTDVLELAIFERRVAGTRSGDSADRCSIYAELQRAPGRCRRQARGKIEQAGLRRIDVVLQPLPSRCPTDEAATRSIVGRLLVDSIATTATRSGVRGWCALECALIIFSLDALRQGYRARRDIDIVQIGVAGFEQHTQGVRARSERHIAHRTIDKCHPARARY